MTILDKSPYIQIYYIFGIHSSVDGTFRLVLVVVVLLLSHIAKFLCPWNFAGKNTGVGCHFLLQGIFQAWRIEPASPAMAGGFFAVEPPWKP